MNQQTLSSLVWSIADLLRGNFRPHEYGHAILPFTILRRLECVLAPIKAVVLKEHAEKVAAGVPFEVFVLRKAGQSFFNVSPLDLETLIGDEDNLRDNLQSYVRGFSADVRDIFERFEFAALVERLHKAGVLYFVIEKFANVNLHPDNVDNIQMERKSMVSYAFL